MHLLKKMQQNLDEAHAEASETERKLRRELGEYIHLWEREFERPRYIMDKMWQLMQSNDTRTMNLNEDFEELLNRAQQTGWDGRTKTRRFWTVQEEEDNPQSKLLCAQTRRWKAWWTLWPNGSPLGEMKVLQGVSVLMSVCVKEWQYKDILNDTDNSVREDLSED